MLSLVAGVASAQQAGTIVGRVTDQTGAPLPGVTIELTTLDGDKATVSDNSGVFRLDRVPTGSAELTFRLINFAVQRRAVDVRDGRTSTADVVLRLSLKADVVVTGTSTFRNIADIENPAENLVGIASAASQGAITAAQLEVRPIMRPGEVLETVPGLIVSQHSGEGKANQYYVRGFNLDHGTDFSTTVAGVPVNMPTGAHAHGYSDLNFLIPELVSGVQFKKGPYFADEGDFSAAGAANINYVNRLDRPLFELGAGQDGWGRIVGAASPRVGAGHLLGAIELNHNDGPWVRPDDYQKLNGVLRYSRGDSRNGFSITGMGYWADWDSTDQVPDRAIASGLIPRFGLLDATDGGTIGRESLAAEFQRSNGPSSIRATGYVLHNRVNLFSNFTYFLDDQDNGDQFEQAERRTTTGGRLTYRRLGHVFQRHTESAIGVQLRQDWLSPVGLYHTAARQRLSTTREDRSARRWPACTRRARSNGRVRSGRRSACAPMPIASTSRRASRSTRATDRMVWSSPKFSAAFGPWHGTELYANAGMGFHSNDARGGVISVNPLTGEPVDRVTPLVRAKGAELGVRTVRAPRTSVDAVTVVSRHRLRAGLRRRRGHDRAGTSEPSRRRRVDELLAAAPMADRRCRPLLLSRRVHRRGSCRREDSRRPGSRDLRRPQPRASPANLRYVRVRHFGPRR